MSVAYDPLTDAFDLDDVDPTKTGGGGDTVAEGSYHFCVNQVVPHTENTGDMLVTCEVLCGKVASEIGKTHNEYLKWPSAGVSEKANQVRKSIMLAWAYALGLTTPEEAAKCKAERRPLAIDWTMMTGRQFVGKVTHESYDRKDGSGKATKAVIQGAAWALNSPKAAGVPLNENMLAKAGDASEAPFGTGDDGLDDLIGT
jgi:hypothetical protein